MGKRKFILIFSILYLFGAILPTFSFAKGNDNYKGNANAHNKCNCEKKNGQYVEKESFKEVLPILQGIENIPEDVVKQGPKKTAKWLQEKTGYLVTVDNKNVLYFSNPANPNSSIIRTFSFNLWGCVGAVGVALLSNGIPFAKLLKIKSAIKALGGTVATVQKIKSYYDKYRFNGFSRTKSLQKAVESASKGLSNDIKGALLDFFNLSNVVANCT